MQGKIKSKVWPMNVMQLLIGVSSSKIYNKDNKLRGMLFMIHICTFIVIGFVIPQFLIKHENKLH